METQVFRCSSPSYIKTVAFAWISTHFSIVSWLLMIPYTIYKCFIHCYCLGNNKKNVVHILYAYAYMLFPPNVSTSTARRAQLVFLKSVGCLLALCCLEYIPWFLQGLYDLHVVPIVTFQLRESLVTSSRPAWDKARIWALPSKCSWLLQYTLSGRQQCTEHFSSNRTVCRWEDDCYCITISLKDVTQLIKSKAKTETCVCSQRGGQRSLHTLVHEEHLVRIFTGVIFWKLPAATASCQVSPKCSSFCTAYWSWVGEGRENS